MSGPSPARHLLEYVRVLRHHVRLMVGVFVVVFCGLVVRVLLAAPAYRSHALLQIEDGAMRGGLLGELQALRGESKTEAEVEIMHSHRVALGAVGLLGQSDFLLEQHAYRPLEMFLRAFRTERPPCRVEIETPPLPDGAPAEHYVLGIGQALEIEKRVENGSGESTTVEGFRPGVPFRALGRTFTLRVEGDASGRRFVFALRSPTDAARWVREHVLARELGRLTGVVQLGFEAESPELARKVADALARSYIDLKREHRREQARTALDFLRKETGRVRERLGEAEEALDRYRSEADAVLLSQRAEWLVEKTSALALERAEQQVLLEEWRRFRDGGVTAENLRDVLALVPEGEADPMTRALAEQVTRLELERDALVEEGYREQHPDRRRVEAEVRMANERLRGTLATRLDRAVERLEARLAHLDGTLEDYGREARALPETERRITELTREVAANLKVHQFLVEKEQEAQLALVSTLGTARLVDPPLAPRFRTSPKLLLQGIVAIVLAAAAAVLLVFFVEYLDRTVKTTRELEEGSGLALFGAVPDFRSTGRGVEGALVARDRPQSSVAEAYRALRTNLRFAALDRPLKTVAITSSLPGEGKSVTSCNLAVAAAQLGERVILVDADLRRPTTHVHLGGDPAPGLTDVLSGTHAWGDVAHEVDESGLFAIHAGSGTDKPAALLESPAFGELLLGLREEFDLVVIDVPPILAVADSAAFLHDLDGVLLLARARACTMEVFRTARDRLRRVGANLLGTVFNGFDARFGESAYGYYGRAYEETKPPAGRPQLAGNGRRR